MVFCGILIQTNSRAVYRRVLANSSPSVRPVSTAAVTTSVLQTPPSTPFYPSDNPTVTPPPWQDNWPLYLRELGWLGRRLAALLRWTVCDAWDMQQLTQLSSDWLLVAKRLHTSRY